MIPQSRAEVATCDKNRVSIRFVTLTAA